MILKFTNKIENFVEFSNIEYKPKILRPKKTDIDLELKFS